MTLASTLFFASLPLLISHYAEKYRLQDLDKAFPNDPPDFGLPVPETFDFIIVGAGTAGCVVANRLSEKYSVLLIEAGGNPPPLQSVPFPWFYTQEYPDINFLYKSTPQKNSGLKNGGVISTTTGKMMGGSSSHNGLIYQRGHPKDFDRWAEETGDESWSYKNVLKYFIKSENYIGKMDLDKKHHGFKGPLSTTEDEYSIGRGRWLQAGRELGYEVSEPNGPQKDGFHMTFMTTLKGERASTYTAYVKPIEGQRKNLKVYRYSYVSNLIIDQKTKTVQGVQYTRHGVPRIAFASKEVILSAGTFVTPLILIKSGIGPLDQLKAAKVEPVSILPVGENLMDHALFVIGPILVDEAEYGWNIEKNLTFTDISNFVDYRKGPLTGLWQGNMGAFISSNHRPHWSDIQFFYSTTEKEENMVSGRVAVNAMSSRGTVKLNTSATGMEDDHLPLIDFNYFEHEADLDVALEGIKTFLKVFEETKTYREIGARLVARPDKNCEHLTFRSDEYWKCYIRFNAGTTWHPTSTCRMGKGAGDPNAVVDSKLRVIGVKHLRVIDASIMPYATNANTYAPAVMIGEKGAAEILKTYSGKYGKPSDDKTCDKDVHNCI